MSTVALEAKVTSPSPYCISLVLNLGESRSAASEFCLES